MKTHIMDALITPILVAVLLVVVSACDSSQIGGSQLAAEEGSAVEGLAKSFDVSRQGPGSLTVMTRNVYVGGNVDLILAAAPEEVPLVVSQIFQQMVSTNFAERADAFARETAATSPHLVGMQEISLIRTQSPGDLIIGGAEPAETVFLDQLDVLMNTLASYGLDYYVAGSVENLDVEVPMLTGISPLSFDDVRLTDFDVLLARGDVEIDNVAEVNYVAELPVPGLGTLQRGYVAADATVYGRTFRVITSHLEPVSVPEILPVHLGQVAELVSATEDLDMPVVVIGDLNTGPGWPGYEALVTSGLVDLWNVNRRPGMGEGYTCCFPDDLRGDSRMPDLRIDLILYKAANDAHGHDGLGSVFVDLLGDEPSDITGSGLWPSDHVGVVATLRAPASAWVN